MNESEVGTNIPLPSISERIKMFFEGKSNVYDGGISWLLILAIFLIVVFVGFVVYFCLIKK